MAVRPGTSGELAAAGSPPVQSPIGVLSDTRGKHRIQAELKRLDQEARFLEEELEQLGKLEKASVACKEMLVNVEKKPEPLLPETNGPINPAWDRWFEGPQDSRSCRCWLFCCKGCRF